MDEQQQAEQTPPAGLTQEDVQKVATQILQPILTDLANFRRLWFELGFSKPDTGSIAGKLFAHLDVPIQVPIVGGQ